MMGWFKGYGIWSRLLSAFGVTTGLTVMATVTALLVFGRSSAILKVFTREHLPDVVEVAALEQVAGEMIATAPMLLTAPDDTAREVIESDLGRLIEEVTHQMDRLGLAGRETRGEVGALLDGLRKNLLALREAVESRDADEALLVAEIKRLRWLYADLLGELEPLNQDLAYNLDSEVERMIGLSLKGDRSFSALRLRENRKSKDTVEKISSNGIFLVTLMLQAATVGGDEQVETLEALSSDAMDFLKVKLAQLPNDASFLTLRQLFDEIFELADGRDALFAIKKRIHEKERLARTILDDNRELVTRLRGLVDTLVARTQKEALGAADGLAETMGRAQLLLIVMALVALISSVGVLWFYVRGSIVRRLDALAKGMQTLAKGDLKGPIPAAGDDEIGEMAQALTVFKETAEARRKTEKELVQAGKLAALGQLTAGISHELNQPLSALGHYLHNARILLDRGELGMHRENLERMEGLVGRMGKMISHLKSFARWPGEGGQMVSVEKVMEHALSLFSSKIKHGNIEVMAPHGADGVCVRAEEIRLEQVLINLISNAVDAVMEKPKGDRAIRLGVEEHGDEVEIIVSDTGPGIAPSHLDSVFDPFFTTKEVGQGLGLGLSISYNIVKDFHGSLGAESSAEGGALFRLRLPST